MATIASVKIHPAIGIARIGNSPDGFFIGPEVPGVFKRPSGGYKDSSGRIKRQAARFRVFGYDSKGKVVREITSPEAAIKCTVHLANRKAAWRRFEGLKRKAPFRNAGIVSRDRLVIDPGERVLSGANQRGLFDTGSFLRVKVPLGEMRTDNVGRLLVLGGFGNSASPSKAKLPEFANNDGWYDDISDGPVQATVVLKGIEQSFTAVGSWVICPPPDFAPAITNVITLYDTLYQVAVDKGWKKPSKRPSFSNDVYPILSRALSMKWVNQLKKMDDADMQIGR